MKLLEYLNRIKQGKPVNYQVFVKLLPPEERVDHQLIFKTHMIAPKKHQVEVLDEDRLEQMLNVISAPVDNRVAAAKAGDSHKVTTSFSHLLVFHDGLSTERPDIVVIHQDKISQGFDSKAQLLIIENEENFFRYQTLLPQLSDFAGQGLDLSNTDIVYGAGNQINKGLNFAFFEQYHNVFCAFDWDLGGLKMFDTLSKGINIPAKFLMPDDLTPWQALFNKRPESAEQWMEARYLAKSLQFEALLAMFNKTRHFLEQEVWL